MPDRSTYDTRHPTRRSQSRKPTWWTESLLRQRVESLQQDIAGHCQPTVVEAIVRLGMQEDIWKALCKRTDPQVATRDLATRYAFAALMLEGQAIYQLDPTSQVLIQRALSLIYRVDSQMARKFGEYPLDEDPGVLLYICKSLSRYVPRKPMYKHIKWKTERYESAVSRAMRQIENLIKRDEIIETFVAYILGTALPDEFKAQLLQMARGGGRRGINYEAVIRFFALPATVEFVKRFADTVQTARTLYDEEEYQEITWQGSRSLPANRRQGYLEAALDSLERRREVSLDTGD